MRSGSSRSRTHRKTVRSGFWNRAPAPRRSGALPCSHRERRAPGRRQLWQAVLSRARTISLHIVVAGKAVAQTKSKAFGGRAAHPALLKAPAVRKGEARVAVVHGRVRAVDRVGVGAGRGAVRRRARVARGLAELVAPSLRLHARRVCGRAAAERGQCGRGGGRTAGHFSPGRPYASGPGVSGVYMPKRPPEPKRVLHGQRERRSVAGRHATPPAPLTSRSVGGPTQTSEHRRLGRGRGWASSRRGATSRT